MVMLRIALLLSVVGIIGAWALEPRASASGAHRSERFALWAAIIATIGAALVAIGLATEQSGWRPIAMVALVSLVAVGALYGGLTGFRGTATVLRALATAVLSAFAFFAILSVGLLFVPAAVASALAVALGLRNRRQREA